jgi:hypothetical protein
MKTKPPYLNFTLLILGLLMSLSCTKDKTIDIPDPDYPQFLGTWQGQTSQSQPITIGIINVNGILTVNTYKYKVIKYDTGTAYKEAAYDLNLSTIVTYVTDKQFRFRPYGGYSYGTDYLKGTFNDSSMTLTGRFNTSFPTSSGTFTDSVTGSFTAKKVN